MFLYFYKKHLKCFTSKASTTHYALCSGRVWPSATGRTDAYMSAQGVTTSSLT